MGSLLTADKSLVVKDAAVGFPACSLATSYSSHTIGIGRQFFDHFEFKLVRKFGICWKTKKNEINFNKIRYYFDTSKSLNNQKLHMSRWRSELCWRVLVTFAVCWRTFQQALRKAYLPTFRDGNKGHLLAKLYRHRTSPLKGEF